MENETNTISPELDAAITAEIAEGTPVIAVGDGETAHQETQTVFHDIDGNVVFFTEDTASHVAI